MSRGRQLEFELGGSLIYGGMTTTTQAAARIEGEVRPQFATVREMPTNSEVGHGLTEG
jgi:hypothetical protein